MKSKDFKAAVVDFDGTLVESMPLMEEMLQKMLRSRRKAPRSELLHDIKPKGFKRGAEYLVKEYELEETPKEIYDSMVANMQKIYEDKIQLRHNVKNFLAYLQKKGIKLAVASANRREFVEAGLNSTGITHFFEFVITCDELNSDKSSDKIFLYCANRFGYKPEEIIVIEDSFIALAIANKAGFQTVGISEETMSGEEKLKLKETADIYFKNFPRIEVDLNE